MWRYPFDAEKVRFDELQAYGFRRDSRDAYLYFLEVRDDRRLHVRARSGLAVPPIPGLPLDGLPVSDGPLLPAENPAIRLFLASGMPRDVWHFTLLPSGRVILNDYQTAIEKSVSAEVVPALLAELEACGVCSLNERFPRASFGTRSLVIELRPDEPQTCFGDLSWEQWTADPNAKRCFDAVHVALLPLRGEIPEGRLP